MWKHFNPSWYNATNSKAVCCNYANLQHFPMRHFSGPFYFNTICNGYDMIFTLPWLILYCYQFVSCLDTLLIYSWLLNVTTMRKDPHACTIGWNIDSNKPHASLGLYNSNAFVVIKASPISSQKSHTVPIGYCDLGYSGPAGYSDLNHNGTWSSCIT